MKPIHRPHFLPCVFDADVYTAFENKLWAWFTRQQQPVEKKAYDGNTYVMSYVCIHNRTSNILFPYDLINLKFLNYYTFSSFRMFNVECCVFFSDNFFPFIPIIFHDFSLYITTILTVYVSKWFGCFVATLIDPCSLSLNPPYFP